jgi:hypothetical protein
MSTDVNGESAPLDKTLATARSRTQVWTLVCMYAVVSLEIGLPAEALGYNINGPVRNIKSVRHTLLHVFQSHWKRLAPDLFSTTSTKSMLCCLLAVGGRRVSVYGFVGFVLRLIVLLGSADLHRTEAIEGQAAGVGSGGSNKKSETEQERQGAAILDRGKDPRQPSPANTNRYRLLERTD